MRRYAALIVLAACSKHAPPPPALLNPPPPPPAPAVQRAHATPPIAPGERRLGQLDIDLAAPPDTTILSLPGGASLTWNGCAIAINAHPLTGEPRTHHRVGTFDVDCVTQPLERDMKGNETKPSSPTCLAVCEHMHAVPGSTAEEHYPTEPPVLELEVMGPFSGTTGERLWRDGTVQYYGPACAVWRGARGQLPRANVEQLLGGLDAGGFFTYVESDDGGRCSDAAIIRITVRDGVREHTLMFDSCSREELSAFAVQLFNSLGENPCSSS